MLCWSTSFLLQLIIHIYHNFFKADIVTNLITLIEKFQE
jgi:hypothetical protein